MAENERELHDQIAGRKKAYAIRLAPSRTSKTGGSVY